MYSCLSTILACQLSCHGGAQPLGVCSAQEASLCGCDVSRRCWPVARVRVLSRPLIDGLAVNPRTRLSMVHARVLRRVLV